jgi:aarF domain-containing kinase
MERLEGMHLTEFLAGNPSQEERNDIARLITRALYRMIYAGRMLYVDMHPGNFLVLGDGRLGVIDFGFIMPLEGEEWEMYRKIDRPLTTGRREDRLPVLKEWSGIRDDETEFLRLTDEFAESNWISRARGGEFDFGGDADFRRSIDLFTEMVRKRYSRARPNTPSVARSQFAWRSIMYQLKARINIRSIAEEEVKVTGWDRSDYAGLQS